jgi:integrase
MRLKKKLTEKELLVLRPLQGSQTDYWEPPAGGYSFGVRVGVVKRTFQMQFRDERNKVKRLSLGVYPKMGLAEARATAQRLGGGAQLGENPVEERRVEIDTRPTFGDLWKRYVAAAETDGRSVEYDSLLAGKHLLPTLEKLPVEEVTRDRVWELQDTIIKTAKADGHKGTSASRSIGVLSRVFNFGIDAGLCGVNPAARLKRRVKEKRREHAYTRAEIRALWAAFDKEPLLSASAFKLRLMLGQRGGEVNAMRWRDIRDGVWTIPPAVHKKRREHKVPLPRQALVILDALRVLTGAGEYVFPADSSAGHMKYLKRARGRIRERSGLKDWESDDKAFNPHDLRHVVVSYMLAKPLSIRPHVVSAVVGHVDKSMARATRIYDSNEYREEKAEALQHWADLLDAILTEKDAPADNVVAMKAGHS